MAKKMLKNAMILVITMMINLLLLNYNISYAKDGSDLKLGDFIKVGQYNNKDIVWRVIEKDESNKKILLVSDKIIMLKAFDAEEDVKLTDAQADAQRSAYGSNYWKNSTLRTWLNSDTSMTESSYDPYTAPSIGLVSSNSYATEDGFLTNFSTNEKSYILNTTHTSIASNTYPDEVANNETTEKVFVLSIAELPKLLDGEYTDYIAYTTQEARDKSTNATDPYYMGARDDSTSWEYWTRDADPDNTGTIDGVYPAGSAGPGSGAAAKSGEWGVRPAMYLSYDGMLVSEENGETPEEAYEMMEDETKNADGLTNNERKKFRYFIGIDNRGVARCMLVAGNESNAVKNNFVANDVVDPITHKFLVDIYYVNSDGIIRKYK